MTHREPERCKDKGEGRRAAQSVSHTIVEETLNQVEVCHVNNI